MGFDLDNEKATDVLIWWVESSNGSIDHSEKEAVKKVLADINYSLETYYQETLMHIGGLGTEKLDQLVDEAIAHGKHNFSDHRKEQTVALLYAVAESNGKVTDDQKKKIKKVQQTFGVEKPMPWQQD